MIGVESGLVIAICIIMALFVAIVVVSAASINIIDEHERGVVLNFGRYLRVLNPGMRLVVPIIQTMEVVDIREKVISVKPQMIITKDNVLVRVNGVVYYAVCDPHKAILKVKDYSMSTQELGQAALRTVIASCDLDQLSDTSIVGKMIQEHMAKDVGDWGVAVRSVQIKEVEVDPTMMADISRQATAERTRRAKMIEAEAEEAAAASYCRAAQMMNETPNAFQIRYLQTLESFASSGRSTTVVVPVTQDLANPPPMITAAIAQQLVEAEKAAEAGNSAQGKTSHPVIPMTKVAAG